MKNLKYLAFSLLAATTVGLSSCSEDVMDDINRDRNHATNTEAKFTVPQIITSSAINVSGGDLNTYAAVAVEHEGGVFNQLYTAEKRDGEWHVASTFNNPWGSLYTNLRNAKIVFDKTADDAAGAAAGNKGIRGLSEVIIALNSAILTDLYGDVPYSEAFQGAAFMQPGLDSQESIYKTIMANVDDAIANLEAAEATNGLGTFDFLYGGKNANWLKFAYGLKARLLMHTVLRAADAKAVYNEIVELCDKSFTGRGDQAAFGDGSIEGVAPMYNTNNWNPTFDFQFSRDYFGVSQSMYDKLMERKDPRVERILFEPYGVHMKSDSENLMLVPNGNPIPNQWVYSYDAYSLAKTAPTHLLSYHEVQFLKAEALARLGKDAEAKACVLNAVKAAFANTEVSVAAALAASDDSGYYFDEAAGDKNVPLTDADAEAYFNRVVAPLAGQALLKEIMNQKYIAMYGANGESLETYNDIRRMKAAGEDFVTLANPKNNTHFPWRYAYGSSDVQANKKVHAAYGNGQYVYTDPVWWAGGTH